MSDILEELIGRQFEIARGEAEALPLPRFDTYTICNLRGGIGKTSLAFRGCPAYILLYQFSPKDTGQSKVK